MIVDSLCTAEEDEITLNKILATMPRFQKAVHDLQNKGFTTKFMYGVADPNGKYTFFKKKGKREYSSDCRFFEGYYLDGMNGAVVCSACTILLPGVIWTLQCQKYHNDCPLRKPSHD